MNNFKDFICHGCLKKYKYEGNFKELVDKKCPHCNHVVWTQEEQNLIEKLETIKDDESATSTIANLQPIERRLLQFWLFAANVTHQLPVLERDFVKDLI